MKFEIKHSYWSPK